VSELRGFQILRLYEIYIEEQMNLQILIAEDEKEKEAIMSQRESRQNRWKLITDQETNKELKKQDEAEKSEKLGDLYDQL
jgi:L-rhamnose mutarotase